MTLTSGAGRRLPGENVVWESGGERRFQDVLGFQLLEFSRPALARSGSRSGLIRGRTRDSTSSVENAADITGTLALCARFLQKYRSERGKARPTPWSLLN